MTGVSAAPTAHSIRAFYSVCFPILRQCLLDDGRTLYLQHRLPAHEREGKVRLKKKVLLKLIKLATFFCIVKRWSLKFLPPCRDFVCSPQHQEKKYTVSFGFWDNCKKLSSGQRCNEKNAVMFGKLYSDCLVFIMVLFFTLKSLMACKCVKLVCVWMKPLYFGWGIFSMEHLPGRIKAVDFEIVLFFWIGKAANKKGGKCTENANCSYWIEPFRKKKLGQIKLTFHSRKILSFDLRCFWYARKHTAFCVFVKYCSHLVVQNIKHNLNTNSHWLCDCKIL